MSAKERVNKAYIESKLSSIFEPMVVQLIKDKPEDIPNYMLKYLKEHYGNRQSVHANERLELQFLREEAAKKKAKGGESTQDEADSDRGSENQSDEDDEDDYVDDLPEEIIKKKGANQRTSVSAEAFGVFNKKGDFKPPTYEKDDELKKKIRARLDQSFMFNALSEEEYDIVILALQNVKKAAGEAVITEGDDGDCLYIVENGLLKCTKVFKGNTEPTFLKNYEPGDAFGELALLYNCPRAATITAEKDSELWMLDRQTFNHIVKDAAAQKREKYEEFLAKVKILSSMEAYERSKLGDAIKEEKYETNDFVISEGQSGDLFYLIMEGEAIATKTIEPGKPAQEVFKYKSGDYFGERALIKNEPRAANIVAMTPLKVLSLDRHSFKRLMGPMEELLKRNMDIYNQFR